MIEDKPTFLQKDGYISITQNGETETFDKKDVRQILDQVRNPFEIAIIGNGSDNDDNYFNSAAIIRTAHNFLANKIFLIERPSFYKKATMGCHRLENIVHLSMSEFLEQTKERNIVSFERRTSITTENLYHFKYPKFPILIFGSEKTGTPDEILKRADHIVSIEQYGIHNDFNISVAAGIAMFDFMSKYKMNKND